MNSRERFLTALKGEQPDRVPFGEIGIVRKFAERFMGWPEKQFTGDLEQNFFTFEEMNAIADALDLDNIFYYLRPPIYCDTHMGTDGIPYYGEGEIKKPEDLDKIKLPDPTDDRLFADAQGFIKNKKDKALCFVTRAGVYPAINSIGFEDFCIALYDQPELVEELMDIYFDWAYIIAERVSDMGFDAYVTTDDVAFKTGPAFSPAMFREIVVPKLKKLRKKLTIPWIMHSDGNIMPFMDDYIEVGIDALHPFESGAVDPIQVKEKYGTSICILGNVDLNILGMGSESDVAREVERLITGLGKDGAYILTSGNCLAGYLKPENVRAMSKSVKEHGRYL